jgi:LPS sulfotransferase NodH
MAEKFAVIAHPRSGSSFLQDILNQHSRVFEAGEVFHVDPETSKYPLEILKKERLGMDDLDLFLTTLASLRQVDTIGFTLFSRPQHVLSDDEAATLAAKRDMQVVFLIRRNMLKAFISWKRGMLTGLWHIDETGRVINYPKWQPAPDVLEQPIGEVDISEAREWIARNKDFLELIEGKLKMIGKSYHKIFYEDLCLKGNQRTLQEVNGALRFLGLEKLAAFEIRKRKMATKSFYQSIPNWQELVDALGYELD